MRSLISKAATVAIIAMASGVAAGQRQIGPMPAVLITPLPPQASMPIVLNQTSVVDRIFSFDANADDRIARDELPERMEGKVSLGDKDHDGFLTRDEVFALVGTPSRTRRIQRFNTRGVTSLTEIVADLKLPPATLDRAMDIVGEQPDPRNLSGPASDGLFARMRKLLDDEDYENFVAAAVRIRNTSRVFAGGVVGGIIRK